jgi:hypothetical protein
MTFLSVNLLMGQDDNRMQLLSSSHSRIDGVSGRMINYRPVYEHKGSTLSADSGFLYRDDLGREYFDAFGNVIITQSNGTMIYARTLKYVAETQFATLTGNVRMVDGESVLTTNFLTYNMRAGIGTYTGGGRIVNQRDTIVSKNAWYFKETKDAYFRHEVIVRTPDVVILTDTMRYNSELKNTYFYGPTNLKGKNGENLYTEEGYYNTESELAEFYKNNLYTEKTRFLKADTLFYDGKSGFGRGVKNVFFVDTTDQFFAEAQKGLYKQEEESILLTELPLVTMVLKNDDGVPDSVYMTADTLFSKMILLKDYKAMNFKLNREGGDFEEEEEDFGNIDGNLNGGAGSDSTQMSLGLPRDATLGLDSIPPLDSTRVLDSIPPLDSVRMVDATRAVDVKSAVDSAKNVKGAIPRVQGSTISNELIADSVLRQKTQFPTGREADSLLNTAMGSIRAATSNSLDSLTLDTVAQVRSTQDSIVQNASNQEMLESDTARTRIIKAYKSVRVYKSDLQAVGDSGIMVIQTP